LENETIFLVHYNLGLCTEYMIYHTLGISTEYKHYINHMHTVFYWAF